MSQIRRQFTRDFKVEAVRLLEESGKTIAEVSRDLGIDRKTITRWRKEYGVDPSNAFRGNGVRTELESELWRLKRENQTLRREREILKKVLGIVSQP